MRYLSFTPRRARVRARPLGLLVTHGPGGVRVSPVPFALYPDEGAMGALRAHLARANPQWRDLAGGEATVVFQGGDAYVSPGWYATKAETGRVVPTWNYEAVHVYGELVWREEHDWLLANVTALSERFEAAQDPPWSVADAPADFIARLANGIVGVEVRITRVEAKRKLSQNRGEADRRGVVAGLERGGEAAVAALMRAKS